MMQLEGAIEDRSIRVSPEQLKQLDKQLGKWEQQRGHTALSGKDLYDRVKKVMQEAQRASNMDVMSVAQQFMMKLDDSREDRSIRVSAEELKKLGEWEQQVGIEVGT